MFHLVALDVVAVLRRIIPDCTTRWQDPTALNQRTPGRRPLRWTGVGAGHPVAEVPFHPGESGVAQPMRGDALGGDPRQPSADASPQEVVVPVGGRTAVAVAQQRVVRRGGPASLGMLAEASGERQRDGLPPLRAALLRQPVQRVVGVQVDQAQRARAPPRRQAVSVCMRSSRAAGAGSVGSGAGSGDATGGGVGTSASTSCSSGQRGRWRSRFT